MLKYLGAIMLVEALTNIITKSELFEPIRKFFFNKNKVFSWVHSLLDCPYCTSVWIALFVLLIFILLNNYYINLFFYGIILHRLSNICHDVIDRVNGTD